MLAAAATPALAAVCEDAVGTLESAEGDVQVQDSGDTDWRVIGPGESLCKAATIRTGSMSRAAVVLLNDEVLRLDQDTTLKLADVPVDVEKPSLLGLAAGAVQSFSRKPRKVNVDTAYMTLAIRGTEFVIRADADRSTLTVFEGEVVAANAKGEVAVPRGQAAVATAGSAPQTFIVAKPRDAAQWSLYFPPIFSAPPAGGAAVDEARRLAATNDFAGAVAALDAVPAGERTAGLETYRAALLLQVGRVGEAQTAIDGALAADPSSADALALRSVIAIVQNQRDQALADARKAVELAPSSAPAKIALSYAQQATLDLEGARATMEQAVAGQPNDALAWSRLSELWLMAGFRDKSREAADRAAALVPQSDRVQTVRGFADLVEFRTSTAIASFEKALELNPSDPMARFGLGLAQIRNGDLAQGRGNIEIAVGLDPSNALLRTYLGKAYFEERRQDIDGQQYEIAKELDPLDPTPYLYDAIRLQTINRPIEGLKQLQTSLRLNENRAVYRSQLLLDADRAARGTSLARIFQDLSFLGVGVDEATNSIRNDPTNPGAHRFLSDVFAGVERREIARVSELLQSQLLQDININPIQPAFAETNLNIVTNGGPATPGYSEFTPLFERNQVVANTTAVVGNNLSYGGEAVASALHNQYSVSGGVFDYRTDGWRDNMDNRQTIYDAFLQAALTPEINAQFEVRRRDSHQGDLDMLWDKDNYSPNDQRDLTQDSVRFGGRYSPNPNHDVLVSAIYTHVNDKTRVIDDFGFGPETQRNNVTEDGYQLEAQHIFKTDSYNIITGGAFNYVKSNDKFDVTGQDATTEEIFSIFEDQDSENTKQTHPYLYGNINLPQPVTWTVGLSYDHYEQGPIEEEKLNPKLGVRWSVTDTFDLRAAAFSVVKPGLTTNRTIEPTQVAGFNQFFDDANGTPSKRAGVGFDWQAADTVFFGGEASWRWVETQYLYGDDDTQHTNWDEQTHSLYAYWAPLDWLSLRADFVYDYFHAEDSLLTEQFIVPEELTTYSVPVGFNVFLPNGLFAGLTTTFVHQKVERSSGNVLDIGEGDDSFALVDFQVGYRLPKRFGVLSLAVNNLFDQSFKYQDNSFREFNDSVSVSPYVPERQVMARLTLNW